MVMNEANFRLAIMLRCPGIGCRYLGKLLTAFPDVQDLWRASGEAMAATGKIPLRLAQRLAAFCREHTAEAEKLAALCKERQIKVVSIMEENYPQVLREIYDPPVLLYYRGTLVPEARRLAMVGSRKYSSYGEATALDFAEKIAAQGLTIVSGAARGIDTFSHRGALKSGRTVAVLGCGVDVAYPFENRKLLQEIAASGGAVVSEYEPGTKPLPQHFPARNRIISGLAEGTLVVEAASRSGSLITAEQALSAGRDVYAIPGSIYSPGCAGCNRLIQQGAKLIMTPADVWEEFQIEAAVPPRKRLNLTPEERQIYQVLSFEHPLTMDEIIMSLPDGEIANISYWLLHMELNGVVIENELHAFRRAERE